MFDAPPPNWTSLGAAGAINSAGNLVYLGTERGCTNLYYCGQSGCGPAGGTQCHVCEAFQESLAGKEGEGCSAERESIEGLKLQSKVSNPQEVSSAAVWKLLRHVLVVVSEQPAACRHSEILWEAALEAVRILSDQARRSFPKIKESFEPTATVTGRRCVEEVKASGGQESLANLENDDIASFWAAGSGEQWLQVRGPVSIAPRAQQTDPCVCPRSR